MIGTIIGDVVGSRFEHKNHRSKDFELFTEACFVTDDSIMTLAVAKALLETDKVALEGPNNTRHDAEYLNILSKNTIVAMQEIGKVYPNCGYGGSFGRWLFSKNPKPYGSYGNGAAMRISPVGAIAESVDEVKLLSRAVTAISHNHFEGLKGAEATAIAIYLARTGHSKVQIREYILDNYYQIYFTLDEIRDSYRFDVTCQGTVPQAIQAFLEADSFEDAIRNAISIGGDSDTLAAITGSIAGAYYGVPDDLAEKAVGYLDDWLLGIYEEWFRLQFHSSHNSEEI